MISYIQMQRKVASKS